MELPTVSQVKQFNKQQIAVLIDQCETAISDMIRSEAGDPNILQLNNFIGKLITIHNLK